MGTHTGEASEASTGLVGSESPAVVGLVERLE